MADINMFQKLPYYVYLQGRKYKINVDFRHIIQIENKIKPYIEANKRLYFVFYELQEDDIKLVKIGGKAFLKAQEINDFTQILPTENISIEEFVNSTTKK